MGKWIKFYGIYLYNEIDDTISTIANTIYCKGFLCHISRSYIPTPTFNFLLGLGDGVAGSHHREGVGCTDTYYSIYYKISDDGLIFILSLWLLKILLYKSIRKFPLI